LATTATIKDHILSSLPVAGENYQWMPKEEYKKKKPGYLYSLKVSSHKKFINYKEKNNNNFTVEKPTISTYRTKVPNRYYAPLFTMEF
jgi:hypothetical protein